MSIWGSANGIDWGSRALISWPEKFYCGTYETFLDLSVRPEIRYLRAAWEVKRWAKGNPAPVFSISVRISPANRNLLALCA